MSIEWPKRMIEANAVTDGFTDYEPWTDGHAIGFKVTMADGLVRYVYLNPSHNEDPAEDPCVFVYLGDHGEPDRDSAEHYYNVRPAG